MSSGRPTSVSILWHMHQPWYGDARTGRMVLPWVRLHATKDYLDMVAAVEEYPEVHVTFNLVPSLLRQIQLYVAGETTDTALELSRKEADQLEPDERRWLLDNAFKCHWAKAVEPYPRFRQLLELRGRNVLPGHWTDAARVFSPRDLRDLQVWFNLAWCGHRLRTSSAVVKDLLARGQDFSEADKLALLAEMAAACEQLLPAWVRLRDAGRIELSTTPYYHPILPLLADFNDVRAGLPDCPLPAGHEPIEDDIRWHLSEGRRLCAELLGEAPVGLWPSEGSVSTRVLELAAEEGFRWAATDEQILTHSLLGHADPRRRPGRAPRPVDYLQPHRHAGLNLFFRHLRASDKVGFDYATWSAAAAVDDLVGLLERTAANGRELARPQVCVILDGENCWEFYDRNGHDFLSRLYAELAAHKWLEPVTFSEHLALAPPPPALDYLYPGSWINHDFYIWAGHREDQRAWELLFLTRRELVAREGGLDEATRRQAWEHLYIAEGSDWFWWYGDDHSSADDATFDELFRSHLKRIWELLGQAPPALLHEPIAGLAPAAPVTVPVAPLAPVIDGRETDFFEWRAAGRINGAGPAGAMTRSGAESHLRRVRYGFDDERFYLALDLHLPGERHKWRVTIDWRADNAALRLAVPQAHRRFKARPVALDGGAGEALVARDRILELSLPRHLLPADAGQQVGVVLTVERDGETVERWPGHGAIELPVPAASDWLSHWLV